MAKRSRKRQERYFDKTEEEWRDWGEKFGKRMGKRGKEFAEEVEDLGEKFSRRFERRGKEWKGWWFNTFGFIGPIIGSIFGIIFVTLGIFALNFINMILQSLFISSISTFLFSNLHWFFAAFLFFGYSDYFSKRFPETYWLVLPIVNSIGIVIVIWIAIWIFNLINVYTHSTVIALASNFLSENLWGIFFVFVIFGYVVMLIKNIYRVFIR